MAGNRRQNRRRKRGPVKRTTNSVSLTVEENQPGEKVEVEINLPGAKIGPESCKEPTNQHSARNNRAATKRLAIWKSGWLYLFASSELRMHFETPVPLRDMQFPSFKVMEVEGYSGYPMVTFEFVSSIRATFYEGPEVKTRLPNGVMIAGMRTVRAFVRTLGGQYEYSVEFMIIPKNFGVFEDNEWITEEGEIPDVILNHDWREGWDQVGKPDLSSRTKVEFV